MNLKELVSKRKTIEDELQYRLDLIIEKIKADQITDTNVAQQRYSQETNNTIRASAEQAYQLAVDYVTQKRKTVGFLTSIDLELIRQQVDEYSLRFWRKVDTVLHRNDVLLQKRNYEPRSPLNTNHMASVVAVAIVTTTMAKATISKINQLHSNIKSAGLASLFRLKDLLEFGTEKGVPRDEFEDQVQWNAILDNKTCIYCMSLHGAYFYYNDPHKPIPGDDIDVHPMCRCFYEYLPSIVEIPLAIQLAKLVRQTQTAVKDSLFPLE